jgi:quinolinate synthase
MTEDSHEAGLILIRRIRERARERNAVLLAHNYQIAEVQDAADFVGDSLELSQKAAAATADVIVFCGVHFLAETAAILAPRKTVLLPDPQAGCPMADMVTGPEIRAWKARYPGRPVVCYVNTPAEVKAECDVCCTSANALRVVESLPDREVLFAPDRNLAAFVARRTTKKIIAWDGFCYVHNNILPRDVRAAKERHPEAEVWAHPECRPEVLDLADRVLSTGQMVREAPGAAVREVILATEPGIIHRLERDNPGKAFYAAHPTIQCVNMKKITLPKVLLALEDMVYRIEVPPDIADRARGAIEKMVRL